MGRLGYLWSGFIAFAVLLALSVPESLYSHSPPIKALADYVSTHVTAIDQFAAVSDFPATVRVVMSILCLFLPPLFLVQWLVPGFVEWQPDRRVHSRVLLLGLIVLVLAAFVWLPFVFTLDADDLANGPRRTRALGLLVHRRFGLGFGAGVYCVCSTWLLALLPRALQALLARRDAPIQAR